MKSVEEIKKILKTRLSEKRLYHSECVMDTCIELARIYSEDENKLALVGIAHDNAREMNDDELISYCNKYSLEINEFEMLNPVLLHAKVGANIAKEEFGFSEDMANAIKYHTVGNVPMDRVSEILFISDSISKDRKYDGIDKLRELAKKDINRTILEIINSTIDLMKLRDKDITEDTLKLKKYYLEKTKKQNS